MNFKRIAILVQKDFMYGPKSFFFIFAVITPIVTSLIVSLVFGSLFSEKPRLGLVDEGHSHMAQMITEVDFIISQRYPSRDDLKQAVAAGALDVGLIFPEQFDERVLANETLELYIYIWGESLIINRAILVTALSDVTQDFTGETSPIEIVSTTLGEGENTTWDKQLLPFLVLMAVIMGGSLVPATALVDEKQKGTLKALIITPTTIADVFVAKGLMGVMLSLLMGVVILAINQVFGLHPFLLLITLLLGATLSATFGIMLGALVKDINTLFATVKAAALFLYAPALIELFPKIPQWLAKFFPTYYIIAPVMTLTQEGGGWSDIAFDIFVLIALILLLSGVIIISLKNKSQEQVI